MIGEEVIGEEVIGEEVIGRGDRGGIGEEVMRERRQDETSSNHIFVATLTYHLEAAVKLSPQEGQHRQ